VCGESSILTGADSGLLVWWPPVLEEKSDVEYVW
jgi:hypothetical protein